MSEAWRPRAGSPIGFVTIGGQRYPVTPDSALMRWLDTMANRLGGAVAPTLPEVAQQAAAQADANAQSLAATLAVLQDNAIPGADAIPPPINSDGTQTLPP